MTPSQHSPPLSRVKAALLGELAGTSRQLVVARLEVKPGAARRLLDLNETDETVYFVSGEGSRSPSAALYAGATFVGVGAVRSRRFEGEARLREATEFVSQTFADMQIPQELAPQVRFFGGASFSPGREGGGNCWTEFGDARFILPRCIYVDDESKPEESAALLCLATKADLDTTLSLCERLLTEIDESASPAFESAGPTTLRREESEEPADWQKLLDGIQAEIHRGRVQKVVAARRVTLQLSAPPRPASILERMNKSAPLCARFCLRVGKKTFIGATPERLILREGKTLCTEALAGSVAASEPNGAQKLLESEKDRREHAHVVAAIREVLAPLCDELRIAEEPEVRRLESIYHLRTPIEGHLREDIHVLALVERLHPTPAVGGLPRAPALAFIDSHERAERGWYAAPVGWIDAAGNGEFAVALRSGLIAGDKVHLYAGAGIVEGSESSAEYAETELKLAGMLSALGIAPSKEAALPPSKQLRDGLVHP